MPNKYFCFIDSGYRYLKVIVGANAEVLWAVEELIWKNNVECFLILRYDESINKLRLSISINKMNDYSLSIQHQAQTINFCYLLLNINLFTLELPHRL